MSKTQTSLKLSSYSVNDMIERLNYLQDNIEVACEDTVAEMVENGREIAIQYDSLTPKTGNDNYSFDSDSEGGKGYISMEGPDSVYVEFGTGDVGLSSPHPLHNSVSGINPYNSGPNIKIDKNGNRYWFAPPTVMKFMSFASGYYKNKSYTNGIPAGCQMYNTLLDLKHIAPSITKKHLNQAIHRL